MKTKLTLVLLMLACLPAMAADPLRYYFSDANNNVWYSFLNTTNLASPTLVSDNADPVGTNAPTYGGHQFSIDSPDLLMDGEVVSVLKWTHNSVHVPANYGFAIDSNGVGWLMTTYYPNNPDYYLFSVNLSTAEVTMVGVVGPWYCPNDCRQYPINGLLLSTIALGYD
jgi:hypothetical protein